MICSSEGHEGDRSVSRNDWWCYCWRCDVLECDPCSIPGGSSVSYEDSTHRFECDGDHELVETALVLPWWGSSE